MKQKIGMLFLGMLLVASANAQQTYQELEQITVNEQVTTVVTASEPIHFVDVSTDKVAGDKPIDNTVRFKPKEGGHADGEVLAIVTIITERYRTQYALVYTTQMEEAVSVMKKVFDTVRNHDFVYKDEHFKISLTGGMAEHKFDNKINETIENADINLYKGKQTGKDKLVY